MVLVREQTGILKSSIDNINTYFGMVDYLAKRKHENIKIPENMISLAVNVLKSVQNKSCFL